jgi:hypothetical protein
VTANASHAARERVNTSATTTSAAPAARHTYARLLRAPIALKRSSGNPNAATCDEVAVAEGAARGAVLSEEIGPNAVRLQQRHHRDEHDRQSKSMNDRTSQTGISQRTRHAKEHYARSADRQRAQRQPSVRRHQRRKSA